MKKFCVLSVLISFLILFSACAGKLHRYQTPSTMPSMVLIEDQVFSLSEKLLKPDFVELHLRDGRKISGKFLSCDRERIEVCPGYTYESRSVQSTPNKGKFLADAGSAVKVDRRQIFDKSQILLLKIW